MYLKKFFNDLRVLPRFLLEVLPGAIVDPNGFGFINFMMENAHVKKEYRHMFIPNYDGAVFVDCGMNVGLITDIARKFDMEVFGFEPNPNAVRLLNKKYEYDNKVHIYPFAVSNVQGNMDLYVDNKRLFDQSASIVKGVAEIEGGDKINNTVKVPVKKLTDILVNDILQKHDHIHLLKIDIEGSEFGVVNDLIDKKLYENITYIVVETHERFFKNGKEMLNELKSKIKRKNINNIYLDWI